MDRNHCKINETTAEEIVSAVGRMNAEIGHLMSLISQSTPKTVCRPICDRLSKAQQIRFMIENLLYDRGPKGDWMRKLTQSVRGARLGFQSPTGAADRKNQF